MLYSSSPSLGSIMFSAAVKLWWRPIDRRAPVLLHALTENTSAAPLRCARGNCAQLGSGRSCAEAPAIYLLWDPNRSAETLYLRIRRRRRTRAAAPSSPDPSSNKLAGSGTATRLSLLGIDIVFPFPWPPTVTTWGL